MTKEEAIKTLEEGKKLTHYYMDSHEWVMLDPDNSGRYKFEDGVSQDIDSFWALRLHAGWLIDWEIVN